MLRMSSPILLALVLGAPVVSSAGQRVRSLPGETGGPPSSLAPGQRGTVTFTHEAARVIACTAKRDKQDKQKMVCSEKTESIDSATSLTLNPIRAEGLGGKDKREKVQAQLPKDGGTPVKLDLPTGIWEIDWAGRSDHDRFYVADADEFAIDLRTQLGSCKKVGDECQLKAEKTKLDVKIPKRCQR